MHRARCASSFGLLDWPDSTSILICKRCFLLCSFQRQLVNSILCLLHHTSQLSLHHTFILSCGTSCLLAQPIFGSWIDCIHIKLQNFNLLLLNLRLLHSGCTVGRPNITTFFAPNFTFLLWHPVYLHSSVLPPIPWFASGLPPFSNQRPGPFNRILKFSPNREFRGIHSEAIKRKYVLCIQLFLWPLLISLHRRIANIMSCNSWKCCLINWSWNLNI